MAASCFRRVDVRNFHLEHDLFIFVARRWRGAIVFVDTEFPGTIHSSTKPYYALSPAERYTLLKANVDEFHPIQVGITICYNGRHSITWQFDLCDFDISRDPHVPESIALLEFSGINLDRIRHWGVPSLWLARLLLNSGLIGIGSLAKWVTFQGGYDIAILLKAVLQLIRPWWMKSVLPLRLEDFLALTRLMFGGGIYDIKFFMQLFGLYGGLEGLANQLRVKRKVGKAHQAGSDSLLISHVFFKMRELYFSKDGAQQDQLPCRGLLFGLSNINN